MARQGGIAEFVFTSIERLLANVGYTINISKDESTFARNILGLRPEHQFIIHNPVQIDFFKPASQEQKLQARKKYGIPEDSILLERRDAFVSKKIPKLFTRPFNPFFEIIRKQDSFT